MITGDKAQVKVVGTSIAFEDEETVRVGNRYSIKNRNKKTWNQSKPIVINPSPSIDDTYQIDYASGYILFDKRKDRGDLTISGEYLPTSILGVATGFTIDKSREFQDVTVLGNLDKEEIPTLKTVSGNINLLEVLDDYFMDKLVNGEKVLLDFTMGDHMESHLVYLDKAGVNAEPGLVKRNIGFIGAK